VLLGLHFLLWMQSLFMISVALSTTIVVTYPAVIAVLERVLLREKLSAQQLAGIILGTAGVAVLVRPSLQNESFVGIALAGAASLLAAGYFMLGRIARRGGEDLFSYVLPAYLMGATTVLLASLFRGVSLLPTTAWTWFFLLLLAIIPMLGGHTVMNYLLGIEKASFVSSIAIGEPVGATILSYFTLHQSITGEAIAGMMITLAGMLLVIVGRGESRN